MITQRSTYQAENWTSNTKKPTYWSPKAIFDTSQFRRVMIQTSLFTFTIRSRIKISPTSTGQKKAASMNFWLLSSRLARSRRHLAEMSDKNQKFKESLLSKKSPQSRKNQWLSMKFIKNLARPLLLDFAGALKKTLRRALKVCVKPASVVAGIAELRWSLFSSQRAFEWI